METNSAGNSEHRSAQSGSTTKYTFNKMSLTLGQLSETDDMSVSGNFKPNNGVQPEETSEINAQESFFTAHDEGWIHGVSPPTTFFKYKQSGSNVAENRSRFYGLEQAIFRPVGQLEPIDHSTIRDKNQDGKTDTSTKTGSDAVETDSSSGGFSGYYSMPKQAINAPLRFTQDNNKRRLLTEIPNCCYHNKGNVNGVSYIFGGLAGSKYNDFSHLNIPNDVDPKKISVYFPYDLPPFVSRDILASPYLVQNPHLIQFNSSRNTITYLDSIARDDIPWKLNGASSCLVTNRHVFFFGGFEIEIDSTEYLPSVDRWIIRKKIVMNDCGYLLDSLTLKFTKIRLDLKNKNDIIRGRVGCGIAANIYEPVESEVDIPVRVPLPPVFTDTSSDTDILIHSTSSDNPPPKVTIQTSSPPQASENHRVIVKTNTNTSQDAKKESAAQEQSHGGSAFKMGNILGKSTKIFHRNHQRKVSTNLGSSPQDTPLNSHLTNTYSQEMSRVRSNSHGNSRPTSPILKAQGHTNTKNAFASPVSAGLKTSHHNTSVSLDRSESLKSSLKASSSQAIQSTALNSKNELAPDSVSITSSDTSPSGNLLFDDSVIKSGIVSVSVFIFGGFRCVLEDGIGKFKATSDLLKIDIGSKDNHETAQFMEEALIYSYQNEGEFPGVNPETHTHVWPEARGYFAYSLVEHHRSYVDNCKWDLYQGTPSLSTFDDLGSFKGEHSLASEHISSFGSSSGNNKSQSAPIQRRKFKTPQTFFSGKAFLIQGGIDERGKSFSDLYLFVFDTGKWVLLSTYVHKYFDSPLGSVPRNIGREAMDFMPPIVEAKLRACHHTALYYKNEERDYLFFVGGITSDALSNDSDSDSDDDKFDVAEYAKFLLCSEDSSLLRIMVLNLQTQSWQFLRYYHGDMSSGNKTFGQMVTDRPWWKNTRICFAGGTIYMNEKSINICHGLAFPVPDTKEKKKGIKEDLPLGYALWGAHVLFSFPSL